MRTSELSRTGWQAVNARARGFTLIEVLVAVVVLAIGILGVAALQTTSMTQGHGSLQASQATALAYDMADRLRANATQAYAGNYYINTVVSTGSAPTVPTGSVCYITSSATNPNCGSANIGTYDAYAWYQLVQQQLSGAQVSVMCSDGTIGVGVACTAPQTFLITIYWNENQNNSKNTSTTLTAANCGITSGSNQYDPTKDLPCVILAVQPS